MLLYFAQIRHRQKNTELCFYNFAPISIFSVIPHLFKYIQLYTDTKVQKNGSTVSRIHDNFTR